MTETFVRLLKKQPFHSAFSESPTMVELRRAPTMMGQQSRTESLFYCFRLEDQIPETHLLRLIDRDIDFSFVRARLKRF